MLPFFKPPVKYACHNILDVFFSLETAGVYGGLLSYNVEGIPTLFEPC